VAVGVVTPLPTDVVIAGVVIVRLAGVDTVTVEGREAEVLSAVLALPDETKVPWIVSEVLRALSMCSLPASLIVCADVTGVTEAEVEDGESRIGPIGARLARDPIFTVIPPDAPFTCNISKGNRCQTKKRLIICLYHPSVFNLQRIQMRISLLVRSNHKHLASPIHHIL
jgi:hypothetical protein